MKVYIYWKICYNIHYYEGYEKSKRIEGTDNFGMNDVALISSIVEQLEAMTHWTWAPSWHLYIDLLSRLIDKFGTIENLAYNIQYAPEVMDYLEEYIKDSNSPDPETAKNTVVTMIGNALKMDEEEIEQMQQEIDDNYV